MNKIFKTCLVIGLFLASSSIAWAGFNYNSLNNNFVIDKNFKTGGDVFIGQDFDDVLKTEAGADNSDFVAVSRNLILLKTASKIVRANDEANNQQFIASKVKVDSTNDFEIRSIEGALTLIGNKINLSRDFYIINNGLSFTTSVPIPIRNNIYVKKVWVNELRLLAGETKSVIGNGTTIKIGPDGTATATSLVIGNEQFCEVKSWNVADNLANALSDGGSGSKDTNAASGCPYDTSTSLTNAKQTCCSPNYYVFDVNVMAGKMVCCRYNQYIPGEGSSSWLPTSFQ